MFTQTSKLFLPVAGAAAFLASVYHVMTRDVRGGVLYLMVSAVAFAFPPPKPPKSAKLQEVWTCPMTGKKVTDKKVDAGSSPA